MASSVSERSTEAVSILTGCALYSPGPIDRRLCFGTDAFQCPFQVKVTLPCCRSQSASSSPISPSNLEPTPPRNRTTCRSRSSTAAEKPKSLCLSRPRERGRREKRQEEGANQPSSTLHSSAPSSWCGRWRLAAIPRPQPTFTSGHCATDQHALVVTAHGRPRLFWLAKAAAAAAGKKGAWLCGAFFVRSVSFVVVVCSALHL